MNDRPEFIIDSDKLESFLPLIGAEVTEEGYIRDLKTGEICRSENGEKLTIDEVGYINHDDEEGIVPVSDNFSDIVGSLSDREFRD